VSTGLQVIIGLLGGLVLLKMLWSMAMDVRRYYQERDEEIERQYQEQQQKRRARDPYASPEDRQH